ncbi:hypothetical protein V0R39_10500 [Pseudomonas inefficax]|nr:hypothetical protein [Pseudomonas inefficax]MEE1907455.1 hypothetical protein [Pseudomonas inefficax]MEE1984919.1 hypothetical protein [Pseudomonas inefficax]
MANINFSSDTYSIPQSIGSWTLTPNYVFPKSAPSGSKNVINESPINEKTSLLVEQTGISTLQKPYVFTDPQEEKEATEFKSGLIAMLENDTFEPDRKSITERYVEQWLIRKPALSQLVIMQLFLESRSNDKRIIGILNLLAHLDVQKFYPANEIIAVGAFSHKSNEVKECALRAFEYWENEELAAGLRNHRLTPQWLDDYRTSIISDICGD